jgi:hypothetical protein
MQPKRDVSIVFSTGTIHHLSVGETSYGVGTLTRTVNTWLTVIFFTLWADFQAKYSLRLSKNALCICIQFGACVVRQNGLIHPCSKSPRSMKT